MPQPAWRLWGTVVGLFLLSAGFIAYAIAPASVLPLFADSFDVGRPAASGSISAVFLTWALLQIPGGYFLDRHDNRRLVAVGGVVFLVAAAAGLLATSYSVFLLTRLVAGASAVFVFVGSVNVLGRLLPENRRALGTSLFVASPPLGVAVAQFAGPRLAAPFGWRGAVAAYLAPSLLGLVVFLALVRRPVAAEGGRGLGGYLRAIRSPPILLVSMASCCTYAVWTFLNTWMPTYGTEVLGIELAAAGAATALVPLAGIVARPGGGWIADRIGGRLVPIICVSFVATVLLLYGLNVAPDASAFAVLLALSGGAVNLAVGLYFVYVHRLADPATAGTSLSVMATFSQVGNLLAPIVGGLVIARLSWTAGFGFAAALALVGLATILLVPPATRRWGRRASAVEATP